MFDAVAALAGIRTHATYEGQAAIDLEQALDDAAEGCYGFDITWKDSIMVFDWRQLIRDIVHDARKGCSSGQIAAKFHRAVVQLLADVTVLANKQYGSTRVVLSEVYSRIPTFFTMAWQGFKERVYCLCQ